MIADDDAVSGKRPGVLLLQPAYRMEGGDLDNSSGHQQLLGFAVAVAIDKLPFLQRGL